jgi:hypothetical protein
MRSSAVLLRQAPDRSAGRNMTQLAKACQGRGKRPKQDFEPHQDTGGERADAKDAHVARASLLLRAHGVLAWRAAIAGSSLTGGYQRPQSKRAVVIIRLQQLQDCGSETGTKRGLLLGVVVGPFVETVVLGIVGPLELSRRARASSRNMKTSANMVVLPY